MKTCQHCGKGIGTDAVNGLCPECLMRVGIGSEVGPSGTDETKASNNTFALPPNAPLSIEEVRKLFPHLEIIEVLGRGGMGVVFKARQPSLDRFVALKLLPTEIAKTPGFAERFAREARALARLSHPNIVAVHDSGNAGGHFYFIMEFVDGANLRQMISSKQITPDAALSIVPKVCEALQFAHDEGILHRDIKPENILIDKKGRVKIADFGLAKLVDDQTTDHSLTGTHQVMGTPRYMAPEQFENTKSVDHRADIYSLGVVFYEMLTGEIPMGRFAVPSKKVQVDVRIDEVVLKSLEREPSQRYQHVSEVKSDVENVTHAGHGAVPVPVEARKVETKVGEGNSDSPTLPAIAPELREKIKGAGILMTIAGIAVALSGFIAFIYGAVMALKFANQTGNTGGAATRAAGGAFEMLLITLCGVAVVVGGLAMRKMRFRSFALAASVILLALPLVLLAAFGLSQLEWVFFQLIFGVYVGFTTFTLLRKPEVEAAFESALQAPTTGKNGGANFQSLEPRLSGGALRATLLTIPGIGAWASLLYALIVSSGGAWLAGDGQWNHDTATLFSGHPFITVLTAIVGLGCLIAAKVLGGAAATEIKNSGGKLNGLPLAAYASNLLPVLVIGTAALCLTHIVQIAVWTKAHTSYNSDATGHLVNPRAPDPSSRPLTGFLLVDMLIVAVACILFARIAWRKIAGEKVPTTGTSGNANFQTLEKPLDHRVSEVVTRGIPGWFNTRAKWVQSLVQTVLMVVFLVGMFAFLSFSFRASSGPGQSEQVIAFGVPAPWLEILNGTTNFQWMIHPFAPSVVLGLLGLAAAFLYEKIRRSRPGFDAEKDRRTTRHWVIAMGLLIAAIITAAVSLTMKKPVSSMYTAVITEDASANEGAASGVHRMFRYNASAPVDHRATFWVEYWRDGKLDEKVGLTGGQMRQLPSRAAFEGSFDFSLADGSKTSPDAAGKVRWDLNVSSRLSDWTSSNGVMKVNNDAGRGGHGNWIADPFAGLDVVSSWGKTRKWNVAIGEPVTVLVLRGYATGENLSAGLNDEDAKKGKATVLVRARFDAVPPGERVEHSQTKMLNAGDVEKLGLPAPKPVAVGKPATVREDAKGVTTNKLFRDFGYRVAAPENCRATFWVELWRDGELQRAAGTTAGQSYDPPRGKNFDGRFIFSMFDAAEWGPGAGGQAMWDFTAESPLFDGPHASNVTKFKPARTDALGAYRKWIGNPFEGLEVRTSWGSKKSWTTIGGEPVTLLMLTGDPAGKAPDAVTDEAAAKRSKVCLLLKVRFDYVLSENLKDASVTRYLSADDIDYRGKPAVVPTTDSRFVIAQDRAKVPATKTAGREEFAFTLSGPTGYTLNVWAEIWQEGRMSILGGLDYHIAPRGGQPIATSFALATMDGDVASVESKGMMRLDWGLDGAWNNNQWRTNIFKGMGTVHRSWDREPRKWNPRPGEIVTLLSITGYKISEFRSAMSLFTEADLIKGWPNAAIIVRAQFTPAKPGEIRDGWGPSVGINGLLNSIGSGRIPYAQFELAKQLGVELTSSGSLADSHGRLVAAAGTKEGQESAVKMLGEFLSEVGYSTSNPDKRGVIEPMNTLWWRARKGQTVNAEELVTVLERFIEDLNTGIRAVWWNRPEPIIKGENGPELSDATAKLLKLTKPQLEEANKIFQKYAQEARALERRNTKIEKNDKGHVLVTISHYSTQCLALASNMVAELGGIVPQNILPAIRPGGLPAVVFGSAGECRTEIEMWKEDGKYHLNVRSRDWLPAPGMSRSDSSFSNVGPDIGTFYGDYRLYWTEE